jgi:hypothetical protein
MGIFANDRFAPEAAATRKSTVMELKLAWVGPAKALSMRASRISALKPEAPTEHLLR